MALIIRAKSCHIILKKVRQETLEISYSLSLSRHISNLVLMIRASALNADYYLIYVLEIREEAKLILNLLFSMIIFH